MIKRGGKTTTSSVDVSSSSLLIKGAEEHRHHRRTDRPFFNPGKPLATKSTLNLYSSVYVDTSVSCSGPRPDQASLKSDLAHPDRECRMIRVDDPYVFNPDQAAIAATQWGGGADIIKDEKPWLKSWYFPSDAFDPWPKKTELRCWHCTHYFDWSPFPLPFSFDIGTSRYRISSGLFCGPSCAKAYIGNQPHSSSNFGAVCNWIDEIAHDYYGYSTKTGGRVHITPAPPKELLKEYCGEKGLSIQQFRTICAHGRSLKILKPGWITIKQVVEAEQVNAKHHTASSLYTKSSPSGHSFRRSDVNTPKVVKMGDALPVTPANPEASSASCIFPCSPATPVIITVGNIAAATTTSSSTSPHRYHSAYHMENPDDIKPTSEIVRVKRIPYVGRNNRRLHDYFEYHRKRK